MTAAASSAMQKVVEAASRRGVAIDLRILPFAPSTPQRFAAAVGVELGRIVTPLVLVAPRFEGRWMTVICLVSGCTRPDLGIVAAMTGEVALRYASAAQAMEFTGHPLEDMPPFGHRRDVRTVLDQDLCQYESVWVSAGSGAVFPIAPMVLRVLSNAVVVRLAEAPWALPTAAQNEAGLQFEAGAGNQAAEA
jgi:prolyl-tRNA editing enzyme YbaK/EbsC (Cys-tRNA(Pro) deacylase)